MDASLRPLIIFMCQEPLDLRQWKRFYLDSQELNLVYLDLSPIYKSEYPDFQRISKSKKLITFSSKKKLREYIDSSKSGIVIDFLNNSFTSKLIRNWIKKSSLKICFPDINLLVEAKYFGNEKKLTKFFRRLYFDRWWLFLNTIRWIGSKFIKDISYDYYLVSGSLCLENLRNNKLKNSEVIYAHSWDYDKYLMQSKEEAKAQHIVYIDQKYWDHPDYKIMKLQPYIKDSSKFINALNDFFEHIEKIYSMPVVIAGHPSANYHDGKTYGNRKIIHHKTEELIKNSKIVICMTSAAINLAILHNKPIIFTYTNEIYKSMIFRRIKSITNYLNVEAINIDTDYSKINFDLIINKSIKEYESFIKEFIKMPGTKESPLWSIVEKHLIQ